VHQLEIKVLELIACSHREILRHVVSKREESHTIH
jgi:hypothetical protein